MDATDAHWAGSYPARRWVVAHLFEDGEPMNVDEYHAITLALESDLEDLGTRPVIEQLRQALEQMIASPQDANAQTRVAAQREEVSAVMARSKSQEFTPRWLGLIEDLGVSPLLPVNLAEQIEDAFSGNDLTPQATLDRVRQLEAEVVELSQELTKATESLAYFQVPTGELRPGEFDASLLVPRRVVENDLHQLGERFAELAEIIRPFVEIATGTRGAIEVKAIASSDFEAFIDLVPQAAVILSSTIDQIIMWFDRVNNLRAIRDTMLENGFTEDEVADVDQKARDHIEEAIPQITRDVLSTADALRGDGREFEIEAELTKSVRKLTERIDHGYRITVRAGPAPEPSEEGEEAASSSEQASIAQMRSQVLENQQRASFHELSGSAVLELEDPSPGDEDPSPGDEEPSA